MRPVIAAALGVAALLLAAVCAASVKWYVIDVLIGMRGEADRSMEFWGLAVLFVGVLAGIGAVGLAVVAVWLLGRKRPNA